MGKKVEAAGIVPYDAVKELVDWWVLVRLCELLVVLSGEVKVRLEAGVEENERGGDRLLD